MDVKSKVVKCEVNVVSIYEEIASNTINDLEIIREGISNSIDENAKRITIKKFIDDEFGLFSVSIGDDGDGMYLNGIGGFFNLAYSRKESNRIGEKGLGTKTYFRCRKLEVVTQRDGKRYKAVLDDPWKKLKNNIELEYTVEEIEPVEGEHGTTVKIIGYAVDHPEKVFDFDILKDYILWRTAAGAFKNKFTSFHELRKRINNMTVSPLVVLEDHIIGRYEEFVGEHRFSLPNENPEVDEDGRQSNDYCKNFGPFHKETYLDGEYISFQIFGTVSGINQRTEITNFKQGEGHKSRFGVILCKDFMYIENTKQEMIDDGNYNAYHVMLNSQNFELTSDRNSIRNKESAAVEWILKEAKKIILRQICKVAKESYFSLVDTEETRIQTKKKIDELNKRLDEYGKKECIPIEGFPIVKMPTNEAQVISILTAMIATGIITDFRIGEYSSRSSTDIIAEMQDGSLELMEVEYCLSRLFAHGHPIDSFDTVVCWELDLPDNYSRVLDGKHLTVKKNSNEVYLQYGVNKKIKIINLKRILTDFKKS